MYVTAEQVASGNLLVTNEVVMEKNVSIYINRLMIEDVARQLKVVECELDELVLLEAFKILYKDNRQGTIAISDVRHRLYRLKSKYRRKLQRQRHKVLESYGLSDVPLKSV